MEPSWEVGKKVYINGTGHMTKMATMPIYGKNISLHLHTNLHFEEQVKIAKLMSHSICMVNNIFSSRST